jgi:TetR/AcrR family fatty acid metabolism transcriptional regulator
MSRNQEKRDQIISSAQEVFSELGFDRARISDIARRAGVADGTIYLYFKSKDDLLISLFEERVAPAMLAIDQRVASGPQDPRGQIASLIRAYLEAMEADPSLGSIITMQVRQSRRFITDYDNRPLARFFEALGHIVKDGVRQGLFRRDISIELLRWMVFGSLDALTLAWSLGRSNKRELTALGDEFIEVLLRGLSTGEQPTLMPQTINEEPPKAAENIAAFDPELD